MMSGRAEVLMAGWVRVCFLWSIMLFFFASPDLLVGVILGLTPTGVWGAIR